MAYRRARGVDTAIVRIFNTRGPRMRPDDGRAVRTFIRQALAGEPLTVAGDGSQTRSIQYADDLVEGCMRLMATPEDVTGPVNLGNPHEIPVRELASTILRLTGSRSPLVFKPLPTDDPRRRRPDITLATEVLGWRPSASLEAGLVRTIEYFERLLGTPGYKVPAAVNGHATQHVA